MKEILYILLDNYAEHEIGFMPGAVSTDAKGFRKEPKYINKMVAPTMEPIKSLGGMRTLPDYSFETMPEDYAALVLIGGFGWMNPEAERVLPIVKDALSKGVVVGAICNAASWMAKQGLLNNIKHTGNGIDQLKLWGGNNYTNEAGYVNEQAVADGRIVTANGSGYLEFTRELLKLLENDTPEMINRWYTFMSVGLVKLYSPRPRFKFNTIGLFTSNNKATVDFYTKAFGFTTDWDGIQPNVEMMLDDMRIILYPRSDFEQMVSYKFQYPEGLNGTVELAFDVPSYADVDKEYQHALRHGAISVLPPTTEPWGQRTCYVADPDGNLIEIGSDSKYCQTTVRHYNKIGWQLKALIARRNQLLDWKNARKEMKTMEKFSIQSLPEIIVASHREVIPDYAAIGPMCVEKIGPEMQRLGCKCPPPGYCFTIEHNKEYTPTDIDIEYCEQVEEMGQDSLIIQFKRLPAVPNALCMKHEGPYERFYESFTEAFRYIEEQGYKVAGQHRTCYIDGAWNQEDPEKWLSVIQIPIE